jgi:hypothetical protein
MEILGGIRMERKGDVLIQQSGQYQEGDELRRRGRFNNSHSRNAVMRKYILIAALNLLIANTAGAAVFFSDNFDSCTVNCDSSTLSPPNSAAWSQWMLGGVADGHPAGEITSPGRGGVGKSLKIWKKLNTNGDYNGSLHLGNFGSYDHFFMRYYIKIPTAMTFSGPQYKMWRLLTTTGQPLYLDYNYGSWDISQNGQGWTTILRASDYESKIHDGNWHSVEWEFDMTNRSSGTVRFWIDDKIIYENTNFKWILTGSFSQLHHFNIGNSGVSNSPWQTDWQAMEMDDLVLSTTAIGPGGSVGSGSPLQPTFPTNIQIRQ